MIIKKHCPTCNAVVEVIRQFDLPGGGMTVTQFACGHYGHVKNLAAKDVLLKSSDGKTPYSFQVDGALWAIKSNVRCLIADQMGLGKTIQALMTVHSDPKELCPFLLVGKAKLKTQYLKETIRWCGMDFMPQILDGEQEFVLPFVKGYIVSYDVLRRFKDLEGWIKKLGIKTIILDEVQAIKNHDSQRTNNVRKIAKDIDHIIALSGTPIKNHAGEYFPILNILRPDKIHSLAAWNRDWVETYWDGYKYKTGGLKDQKRFEEFTKDFILRRTREEVMPDLPVMQRNALFCDLGVEVEKAYKETLKQFQAFYNGNQPGMSALERQSNIMAYLSKMRHLTGIAKIQPTIEYVKDFLNDTDRKIVLFVHHKDVAVALKAQLEALTYDDVPHEAWNRQIATFAAETKDMQVQQDLFWGTCRIAIASTLAAGEGLNLQCCSDMILVERQWNPANEEQAEGRFIRIGQQATSVSGTYMVAVGTVDEFFAELVERKRALVDNTLDGKEYSWDETSLIQELAEVLAAKGGQKWGW